MGTFSKNSLNLTLLNTNSSNSQNFNLFEYSQLWNNKKFFFTNQLKSQVSELSNLPNKNLYETKIINNNTK